MQIWFNNERTEEQGPREGHSVRLPKEARVSQALTEVAKLLEPAYRDRPLRLLELWQAKIYKVWLFPCMSGGAGCASNHG